MKLRIHSLHFDADKKLEEYISKKMNKILDRYKFILSADITLRIDRPESVNNKIIEAMLEIPGNNIFVKKQGNTFEEVTDKIVDVLKRQLEKVKEK